MSPYLVLQARANLSGGLFLPLQESPSLAQLVLPLGTPAFPKLFLGPFDSPFLLAGLS